MSSNLNRFFQNDQKKYLLGGVGLLALIGFGKFIRARSLQNHYNKIYKQKREALQASLNEYKMNAQQSGLSNEEEKTILNSTIKDIKKILYEKKATVKQVLLVFINQILKVATQENLNLITDIIFKEALIEAEKQDQEISQDPEVIYQYELFGIPVSVKETYIIKGFDNTYGLASRCLKPAQYDGIQISLIKKAKGIIFVRSNIPQLAMTFESVNRIYGRSLNPWNKSRSVGGSSGGEAALQASRCSVIGIGSDIAGSIRIPSAFCGIYGLKPGIGRQTEVGEGIIEKAAGGMVNIKPTKGPLGRSVDDLYTMLKVLFNSNYYNELPFNVKDPYWYPIGMKELPNKKKLKIGYIESFWHLIPPNCMRRGVREACHALVQQGHEIVEIKLDKDLENELVCALPRLVSAEGGFRSFEENLKGEKIISEYELMKVGAKTPVWVSQYILGPLLRIFGQKTLYFMGTQTHGVDVYQYLVNSNKQKEMNFKFLQFLKNQDIDAWIVPGFGCPAVQHGASKELPLAALYTWIWNSVDVPTGSMPITLVQGQDDQKISGKENTYDLIYTYLRKSMIGTEGLPVNVQIISYPYQEEMVLKVMKEIESVVKFNEKHPYPY